ncbi:MAG: leucine-rich repeat protein [Lachnospiraceae bacterium]|nr:leucine-rich repeat protein [Lachnospiraceae bacterium]
MKSKKIKTRVKGKRISSRILALFMACCVSFTGLGSNLNTVCAQPQDVEDVSDVSVSIDEEMLSDIEQSSGSVLVEDEECEGVYYNSNSQMTDFRDETIYFLLTTRFYDGDSSNNVQCWDAQQLNENDPPWRGDFKGLIEKLDYIKALGFTAIWITPVVENASGYDYHGYHAIDFSEVDPRYESEGATYQDLIDAAHDKGMKVIQDVVFNHTGNWGENNLYPIATKDYSQDLSDCEATMVLNKNYNWDMKGDYYSLEPTPQFNVREALIMNGENDTEDIYHHNDYIKGWETYQEQITTIAGDCMDLNTENPEVYHYLVDCYSKYIDMGVDAFRIDTVKHVSRLTFNNAFISQLNDAYNKKHGTTGEGNFYMFGEACTRVRGVWNRDIPALSAPFFTWKEEKEYAWDDSETDAAIATNTASVAQAYEDNKNVDNEPTSTNAFLDGNNYHTPDYSDASGMNVIDFPMHWNFANARDAFSVAVGGDQYYNDATYNVTYVDSHDYAPDGAPETQRFAGTTATWAENLSLMFTFRGIPCIYYGSEVEFQKGKVIDPGNTKPLSETGRAYFGDYIEGSVDVVDFGRYSNATGAMADSLEYPLSQHIQRLNRLRAAIPALRKGQYSTENCSGDGMAFKRRYTDATTDSFALVTISGNATFSNIPGGTYVDAITGDTKTVAEGGSITTSGVKGQGDLRVYVLSTSKTSAPGMIDGFSDYMSGGCELVVDVVQPTGITLDKTTADLDLGDTATFTATVAPSNATNKSVTWSSSNASVATVAGGKVTAKGEGTATITAATNNGLKATATVTVKATGVKVDSVTLDKTAVTLEAGQTAQVNATILPANAEPKYAALTWKSSNTKVATISNSGLITAISSGTATITAETASGVSATMQVTVNGSKIYGNAIYFQKPDNWGNNIRAYFWTGSGTWTNASWPGTAMTEVEDGLYGIEWPEGKENETLNVIFNDGSNQTGDLVAQINTCFNINGYVKDMPVNEKPIDATITVSLADTGTEYVYNGKEHKAKVVVKADDTVLTENTDYTLSYSNNVNAGTATVKATVTGTYTGEASCNFTIQPKKLTDTDVAEITGTYIYTGAEIKPDVSVTGVEDDTKDCSISYSNNINAGTATVTITGSGNYKGSVNKTFTIEKADAPKNVPTDSVVTANTKLSEIPLNNGWTWSAEDADKTVGANETLEVTAIYTGADASNYKSVTVTIKVTGTNCAHSGNREVKNVVKATCTKDGYTGDEYCKECGTIVVTGSVVPQTGHAWNDGTVTIEPTEVSSGIKTYTCTNCSDIKTEVLQPLSGHEHVWDDGLVTKQPTETAEGEKTYHCTIGDCNQTKTEKIAKLPHTTHVWDGGTVTKQPTETEDGETTYHCTAEGCDETKTESISKLGHTTHVWDKGTVTKQPTETEEGEMLYTCTINGCEVTMTEILDRVTPEVCTHTGEKELKDVVKATCTQDGYSGDKYCKNCGEMIKKGNVVAKTGHTWDEGTVTKQPTQTTEGEKTYYCTTTGCNGTKTDKIDKLSQTTCTHTGNREVKNVTKETCTQNGYTGDEYCKDCGAVVKKGEVIASTGKHTWDNGTITQAPTETTTGIKTYTCTTCATTQTETVPATGGNQSKPGVIVTSDGVVEAGDVVEDSLAKTKYRVTQSKSNTKTVEYVISNNNAETIEVPNTITINGTEYKVTSIADNAFKKKYKLKSITIGKNVKTIGDDAFYKCTSLTSVKLPSSVTKIGENAFYGCKKLKSVTLSSKLTTIDDKAFYKCTALTSITIPSKVNKIGEKAFYGCKKLNKITINTSKLTDKKVGSKAFKGIASKATIKVPKKKVSDYEKLLKKKGVSKKATIKKK